MKNNLRLAVLALIAVTTIGCDRVTKHMAVTTLAGEPMKSFFADTIRLVYAENTGGFLSLGAGLPPILRTVLFTVATGIILILLTVLAIRSQRTIWQTAGLALVVAGGVSNWIDRLMRGSVVDFMNVGVGWMRTGIFNVADAAILLGMGILLLAGLRIRGAPDSHRMRVST